MLSSLFYIFALFAVTSYANIEEVSANQLHEPETKCIFSVHDKGPKGVEVTG